MDVCAVVVNGIPENVDPKISTNAAAAAIEAASAVDLLVSMAVVWYGG